ncbi:MAG: cyclic pyranopterin monophosphate synthase MoaC [Bacteriovoracaceae bacterium]
MLTHIDQNNQPTMVDVTEKNISERSARAQSTIRLPEEMRSFFRDDELVLKKGPVFQTAIIAGTMAVKRTHEMIPFCHQIPVESCKFQITTDKELKVTIECTVKTTYKTGVEMEALHGATIAALTIYDMCKAISHNMEIGETKLMTKTGGKRTVLDRPLYGLVLTGGKSERMKREKALIEYKGVPHAQYISQILGKFCDEVFLSAREGQWQRTSLENHPVIVDSVDTKGPIAGILSALKTKPEANWIVVACDLVHFNEETVTKLLAAYDPKFPATAYKNSDKGFPEPLCAIYTPIAQVMFEEAVKNDITCPVKVLRNSSVHTIDQTGSVNLANINTVEELMEAQNEIH